MDKLDFDIENTHFASADRAENDVIQLQREMVCKSRRVSDLLDGLPEMVMILNLHRQIIYANKFFCDFLKITEDSIMGKRLGEALECVHSFEGPSGCGTSEACKNCHAVLAILNGQKQSSACDCMVRKNHGDSYDFNITACPFVVSGESYELLIVKDLSDSKRREVLERTFFHDILNTAGAIKGIIDVSCTAFPSGSPFQELLSQLKVLACYLVDEINGQQDLVNAEAGRLYVEPEKFDVATLLEDMVKIYKDYPGLPCKNIVIPDQSWSGIVETDKKLLRRVLGNMLKNALEASERDDIVVVFSQSIGDEVKISVQNDAVILKEIQPRIFTRSFSTKAVKGRGVGTHSMKLIGEKYLGGDVSFVSKPNVGTVFTIKLNKTFTQQE